MLNQIVKPFGVSVEAAFRRVEIISNLMECFPPPCSNRKEPTQAQWNKFTLVKKLSEEEKREVKYNFLPQSFCDCIDDANKDWTKWTGVKFLAQVQKCEAADQHDAAHKSKEKSKEKGKCKREDNEDSTTSNLSLAQKGRNNNLKKKRKGRDTSNSGKACLCKL